MWALGRPVPAGVGLPCAGHICLKARFLGGLLCLGDPCPQAPVPDGGTLGVCSYVCSFLYLEKLGANLGEGKPSRVILWQIAGYPPLPPKENA